MYMGSVRGLAAAAAEVSSRGIIFVATGVGVKAAGLAGVSDAIGPVLPFPLLLDIYTPTSWI